MVLPVKSIPGCFLQNMLIKNNQTWEKFLEQPDNSEKFQKKLFFLQHHGKN